MNEADIKAALQKHLKWLQGANDGGRADLSWANLGGADLCQANLGRADLSWANLGGANLRGANLGGANLRGADLSWANLGGANLRGADLCQANLGRADLRGADLGKTCLDPELHALHRVFCQACPPILHGGRIVYRTARSQHIGNTDYTPGHTYVAPALSFDCATACHPGIYAGSLEWMRDVYPGTKLVYGYVRDGDWIISAKGAIRCARLRVLGYVETDNAI